MQCTHAAVGDADRGDILNVLRVRVVCREERGWRELETEVVSICKLPFIERELFVWVFLAPWSFGIPSFSVINWLMRSLTLGKRFKLGFKLEIIRIIIKCFWNEIDVWITEPLSETRALIQLRYNIGVDIDQQLDGMDGQVRWTREIVPQVMVGWLSIGRDGLWFQWAAAATT